MPLDRSIGQNHVKVKGCQVCQKLFPSHAEQESTLSENQSTGSTERWTISSRFFLLCSAFAKDPIFEI